jgi:hypothetical protein
MIIKFINKTAYMGYPKIISMLLTHGREITFGKPKDGKFDDDLRPIIIAFSILRLCDKVYFVLFRKKRELIVGPYQIIGKQRALEKSRYIMAQANRLMKENDYLVMINADITNAYNSVSRKTTYEILKKKCKLICNWFVLLYQTRNRIEIDCDHYIIMKTGKFQGLVSSEWFYSGNKFEIINNALTILKIHVNHKACLYFQIDYVDDGNQLIPINYFEMYLCILVKEYKKSGMELNMDKTKIILITKNEKYIELITKLGLKYNFKYNFEGNYKFLGVPYGTNEYINLYMNDKLNKINIVLNNILLFENAFIKHNLLAKFFDYNKIIYYLKVVKYNDEWMNKLIIIYNKISNELLDGMNVNEIMKLQIQLSIGNGGFAFRYPPNYKKLAELSSIIGIENEIEKYFPFMENSYNIHLSLAFVFQDFITGLNAL